MKNSKKSNCRQSGNAGKNTNQNTKKRNYPNDNFTKQSDDNFMMSPKVDYAFKELMKNEKVRKGFISAVLDIPVEHIKSTRLLDTHLRKQLEEEKQGILDIRICMNDNTEIDIEMQVGKILIWADRSLFYAAKMYTEHIKKGQSYLTTRKCINITIADFILFPESNDFYSCFHLWEDTKRILYTEKLEFHIFELPKLQNDLQPDWEKLKDSNSKELWARFINAKSKEEFAMFAKENEYLKEAYDKLKEMSYDSEKRMEYDLRLRNYMDYRAFVEQAELAEQKRELAEQQREQAEQQREQAEQQRALAVQQLEQTKQKLKQELKQEKSRMVLDMAADLGAVPKEVEEKILSESDEKVLKKWIKLICSCDTIEDFIKTISI